MKTYQVGEFKTHFAEIIEQVRAGEEIISSYGKKKENVAVLIPYAAYKTKKIRLGLLQEKRLTIHDDFKMSAEELLGRLPLVGNLLSTATERRPQRSL